MTYPAIYLEIFPGTRTEMVCHIPKCGKTILSFDAADMSLAWFNEAADRHMDKHHADLRPVLPDF